MSLNQINRSCILLSTHDQIVDDRKDHGSAEHDYIPIHGLSSNILVDWEEYEYPNYQEETYSSDIDEYSNTSE